VVKTIAVELKRHTPFTAFGALSGIAIMAIIILANVPAGMSEVIFFIFHPAHVVLSALVTTAMYRRYGRGRLWAAILIGYTGSIGIATLSDSIIPYLGGVLLGAEMEFHVGFIEKWWLINPLAFLGIAVGYLRPTTEFPHAGHVLLSTWASLFYFAAFGVAKWIPLLPLIFLFLFLAVWLPCCVSDIVYPLLFLRGDKPQSTASRHHH